MMSKQSQIGTIGFILFCSRLVATRLATEYVGGQHGGRKQGYQSGPEDSDSG